MVISECAERLSFTAMNIIRLHPVCFRLSYWWNKSFITHFQWQILDEDEKFTKLKQLLVQYFKATYIHFPKRRLRGRFKPHLLPTCVVSKKSGLSLSRPTKVTETFSSALQWWANCLYSGRFIVFKTQQNVYKFQIFYRIKCFATHSYMLSAHWVIFTWTNFLRLLPALRQESH